MNFGTLIQLLGDITDDQNNNKYPLPFKKRRINQAIRELRPKILAVNKRFYLKAGTIVTATVSGSYPYLYDLPSDCDGIIDIIKDSNNKEIMPRDWQMFDISDTDKADFYGVFGNQVWLSPTPNSDETYSLYYYHIPAELVNTTDTLFFPPSYEDLVIYQSCLSAKLKTDENYGNPAILFKILYNDYKNNFDMQTRHPEGIQKISDTEGKYQILKDEYSET